MRAVLACSAVAYGNFMRKDVNAVVEAQWQEFKVKYGKKYSVYEEAKRKAYFIDNLDRMKALDVNDSNWMPSSHLSPLADWSHAQFSSRNSLQAANRKKDAAKNVLRVSVSTTNTPSEFDWRKKGGVVDVKNQGQCGSCWAFSTLANIEGVNFVENGQLVSLSEQELVDCDQNDNGCDGGLPEMADKWLVANQLGMELTSDYPYTGEVGECAADVTREKVWVHNFIHISQVEDEIAAAIVKYGPLSIGINASPMQMYMGGVQDPDDCDPEALNHGVTLVGFGVDTSAPANPKEFKKLMSTFHQNKALGMALHHEMPVGKNFGAGVPYWSIKNSWGTSWGEDGYYRIVRGKGACGMNSLVTTAQDVKDYPPKAVEPKVNEVWN